MPPPYEPHRHEPASRWQLELQRSTAEITERAVISELGKHRNDQSYYPAVDHLVVWLQRVAQYVRNVDSVPVAEFVEVSLEAAVMAGPGRGFRLAGDFLDAIDRIIELLASYDRPVTSLLLAKARYQAVLNSTGKERSDSINRAISVSRSPEERASALLMLAEYHIDSSKYRKARSASRTCDRMLANSSLRKVYAAEISTIIGQSYFFTSVNESERHFSAAIAAGSGLLEVDSARFAVSTAHHYLGRIQAMRGEFKNSLESYVAAEKISDHRLAASGWYHLRVAEVLFQCGTDNEIYYHLNEAQRIFAQGQVISSGDVILNATWARYYTHIGDRDSAEHLLIKAVNSAHADGYSRGELVCLLQLLRLRLASRRYPSCLAILIRSGLVFLLSEASSGPGAVPAQLWTVLTFARTVVSLGTARTPSRTTVVHCPCGDNHVGRRPPDEESRRGGTVEQGLAWTP